MINSAIRVTLHMITREMSKLTPVFPSATSLLSQGRVPETVGSRSAKAILPVAGFSPGVPTLLC